MDEYIRQYQRLLEEVESAPSTNKIKNTKDHLVMPISLKEEDCTPPAIPRRDNRMVNILPIGVKEVRLQLEMRGIKGPEFNALYRSKRVLLAPVPLAQRRQTTDANKANLKPMMNANANTRTNLTTPTTRRPLTPPPLRIPANSQKNQSKMSEPRLADKLCNASASMVGAYMSSNESLAPIDVEAVAGIELINHSLYIPTWLLPTKPNTLFDTPRQVPRSPSPPPTPTTPHKGVDKLELKPMMIDWCLRNASDETLVSVGVEAVAGMEFHERLSLAI
ncbi:hypothetical protein EJ06DRAFT_580497 [Trichodelitschia bisporula]|uniref:Uncharacterized protein n=1 Tax=Trichodelitschia bisporula TaxID=703511 RepID=A0A6G1I237_9PEZI|nr:hypothetical protein EJ06DRAFT_580497 [Trichodelitschia bisporula]